MTFIKKHRIAILQSNYIPWRGYFDLIDQVDTFVFYDEMQFTRRDWRNRNKIKTQSGAQWLTIPVQTKGKYYQKISKTHISDPHWAEKHWNKIEAAYRLSRFFNDYEPLVKGWYESVHNFESLSEINHFLIRSICYELGITTRFCCSSEFEFHEDRSQRLVGICEQLKGTSYLSGPGAAAYLEKSSFTDVGIKVAWMSYDNYPVYEQLHSEFIPDLTILDIIFNCGELAAQNALSRLRA